MSHSDYKFIAVALALLAFGAYLYQYAQTSVGDMIVVPKNHACTMCDSSIHNVLIADTYAGPYSGDHCRILSGDQIQVIANESDFVMAEVISQVESAYHAESRCSISEKILFLREHDAKVPGTTWVSFLYHIKKADETKQLIKAVQEHME
jgi:hypothetical protein